MKKHFHPDPEALFITLERLTAGQRMANPFVSCSGQVLLIHILQQLYEAFSTHGTFFTPTQLVVDEELSITQLNDDRPFLGFPSKVVIGEKWPHFLAAASLHDFGSTLPAGVYYIHLVDSDRSVITGLYRDDGARTFTLMIPDAACPDAAVRKLYHDIVVELCGYSVRDLQLLQNVYDYILAHLFEPLPTNAQLARMFFTNRQKLKELFRFMLGTSVYRFYNNTRLSHAHQLIEQTQLPLHDIAALCGFSGFRHFSRLFFKFYGYRPGVVRRWKGLEF